MSPNDTFLLYKKLLPLKGIIKEGLFGIFSTDSDISVNYFGGRQGNFDYYTDNDIKPVLDPASYIWMLPNTAMSLTVNLANAYNFSPLLAKGEHHFAIAPNVDMPVVTTQLEHVFKVDTIDHVKKPVYYYISPSNNWNNIDSMRQLFYVP